MKKPKIDWPSQKKTDAILAETGLSKSEMEDLIGSGIRRGEHLADVAMTYLEPFVEGDEDDWEGRWNGDGVLTMWFGRIDAPNHATDVQRRLRSAYDRLSDEVLTVNIKDELPKDYHAQNLGAFLSPKAFRVAPEWFTYSDTKRGSILIHELLHEWFPDQELESGDKVYGSTKAKQLAIEDPYHARRSPENYEWLCVHLDDPGSDGDWEPAGGYFPAGAEVRAVSRRPAQLDAFVIGNNGVVFTSSWTSAGGWSGAQDDWWPIGGDFASGGPLAVVARSSDHLDVFHRAKNGQVHSSAWTPEDGWSGVDGDWWRIGDPVVADVPFGPVLSRMPTVSAVARRADRLDLVTTGANGFVYTSAWSPGAGWSPWSSIGGGFPGNAPLSIVARTPDVLDVFATDDDGVVRTSSWSEERGWSGLDGGWWRVGGSFPDGAPVAVAARTPENLDVFVVGSDGAVHTSAWSPGQGWSGADDDWWSLGGSFSPGAAAAVVAPDAGRLEVYVPDRDGVVHQAVWTAGTGWEPFVALDDLGPAGVPVGTLVDAVDHGDVSLLMTGANGVVYVSDRARVHP
ncbi:hypothetical protein [Cellulomonas cellasea]|uniref:Uncharacterized protein n=1 Tax=Cellulomonas cellasea TaxID=43670 RepID=A0A7W4UGH5_9CELL|nr:hypothetical protein [Cellulomonas cellasea]MBB2923751.1 hypothetical protein [Cellulomonas cellasea]